MLVFFPLLKSFGKKFKTLEKRGEKSQKFLNVRNYSNFWESLDSGEQRYPEKKFAFKR